MFTEFQQNVANIRTQQQEEQKELEDTYAVLLKTKFAEWVTALERILRVPLPEKIPLKSSEDFELETGMKGLGKDLARDLHKKYDDKKTSQIYFYTHSIHIKFIPVEKRMLGSWREIESEAREATPREFIEKRLYVKHALFAMFPERTRSRLRKI